METSLNAVLALHRAGRLDEAERGYEVLLTRHPVDPDLLHLLGFLRHQQGRSAEGLALVDRAVAQATDVALYHGNRGEILLSMGRRIEAEAALRQALSADPGFTPARVTLAKLLLERDEPEAALAVAGIELGTDAALLINRGLALSMLGRKLAAAGALSRALELAPGLAAAHSNLGNVLRDLGNWPEALAQYRRALELDPNLFVTHSNILYTLLYDPSASGPSILAEGRRWEERHGTPAADPVRARNPDKRLRIGYVSPDFKEHAVAFFTEPLLRHHDRTEVEVFCYSATARPDKTTERLRGLADGWRDILGMDDGQLARQIRADGIDILVDLAGHTAGNRLLAMASRPAPVQVSFVLGHGGTTGLSWIDLIVTDAVITPPGFEDHFSERVTRLPGVFAAITPRADWPDVLAQPEGPPVLGFFTDPSRVDGAQVELWRRALDRLPGARILFKHGTYDTPEMAEYWRGLFGLVADRADFEGVPDGWGANMEVYGRVSVMLDSWPASSASATLIMVWMGLPVVTLAGHQANQRFTASIVGAAGLPELAATDGDAYVRLLVELASDRARLAELRSTLRRRMLASPLLDVEGYARSAERAYRVLWRDACDTGEPLT
jgi:protein O-GlcNAc transferase